MCGITGIFSKNDKLPDGLIEKMNQQLSHRGPDHSECVTFKNNNVALGHNRLAIIDLNDDSNQPFFSDGKRTCLVFNGEIYNFLEIRNELITKHNVTFKTNSDTEVVMRAFETWGEDFIHKLNGMFAIAIYAENTNTLLIFRDRIGIKPLYYYYRDGVFAFASELKALLPLTKVFGEFSLNKKAMSSYFRLGYVPAPYSIYEEIQKLNPGTQITMNEEGIKEQKYYSLTSKIENDATYKDEKEAKNALKDLLNSSIKQHLISDVPFGVFLSGGIDSSTVAAYANKHNRTGKLNTFSIGFKEQTHDESQYAEKVAQTLKTAHHKFEVNYSDALNLIPEINSWYDEPFADSSAIPTYLVSKMAKKEVKMVLTGDGGDEQFLGYGMYNWAERMAKWDSELLNPLFKSILKLGGNRFKRAAAMFDKSNEAEIHSHIFSVEQYFFNQNELNKVLNKDKTLFWKPDNIKFNRELSAAEKQAFFDLSYYLPEDLLVKVDRATMQNALEARVPLLDHRIVEFSMNLSKNLKLKKGDSKYLLKSVLYDELPKSLFDRPKWGFSIPLNQWLLNELKSSLDACLSSSNLAEIDFLNEKEILDLKKRFFKGENYLYNKLWMLYIFVDWYQKNKIYFEEK